MWSWGGGSRFAEGRINCSNKVWGPSVSPSLPLSSTQHRVPIPSRPCHPLCTGCGACTIQLSSWMREEGDMTLPVDLSEGKGSGQAVQPRPPPFSGHHGVGPSRNRVGKAPTSRIQESLFQVKAGGSVLVSPPAEFGCFKIVVGCFGSLLKGAACLSVNLS